MASASSWLRSIKHDEAGHEQHAAAHADHPAEHAGGEGDDEQADDVHQKTSSAAENTSSTANTALTARCGTRCWSAVPGHDAGDGGRRDQEALGEVDVAEGAVRRPRRAARSATIAPSEVPVASRSS